MMLGVLVFVLIAPQLNLLTMLTGTVGFTGVITIFGSTEYGRKRLDSISETLYSTRIWISLGQFFYHRVITIASIGGWPSGLICSKFYRIIQFGVSDWG